jgi:hypothetical protein
MLKIYFDMIFFYIFLNFLYNMAIEIKTSLMKEISEKY